METGMKRRRPGKQTQKKTTTQFRAPRQRQQNNSVIPGLLRQTGTEKKVLFAGSADPVNVSLVMNQTGTLACINLIAVGSSMFNRVGRKIEMRSVRLNANIVTLAVTRATIVPDFARIMVVYDRQTNGAFPAIADIIQDTDQAGTNFNDTMGGLNMNNRERFVTIIDKRITLPQATATAGVLTNVFPNDVQVPTRIDEFRRLKGLTTHFKADSATAVIGDISTGALYIMSVAGTQAAGTELFNYAWNIRLKYVDL